MNDNPSGNVAPLDEELVAYLDGELDAEGARRIEALLASDPEVRRRLRLFERTWDLLDELDAAPAGEPFTQTTLEMVAIAARQDAEQDKADAPRRRRRWLFLVGVSLLAAAACGFLAVAAYDPDRQLVRDLALLEYLDEYLEVDSIEFLRMLRDEKLFSKDVADPAKSEMPDNEDAASPRQRIKDMSLDEKEQLLRSEARLAKMTSEARLRVRRLHEELQKDPDRDGLLAVMRDYCEWLTLNPLSPSRWDQVAKMEVSDRVAWVKEQLRQEQRVEGKRRPGRKDMDALWKWVNDNALRHKSELLDSMPKTQQKPFEKMNKPRQQQMLLRELWQRWQAAKPGKLPPMLTEEDLTQLRATLSSATQKRLEGKLPVKQWNLVEDWIRQWLWEEWRRMRGPLQVDDERLAEFFENDLTLEQRDQLLAMPGEDMQWRLQQMYWGRSRPLEGQGHGPRHTRHRGDANPPMPWKSGPAPPMPPTK
jgi:hypothetical protein